MRLSGWLTAILAGLVAFTSSAVHAGDPAAVPTQSTVDGRTFAQWIKDLTDPDASIKEAAIRAVVLFPGPHGDVLVSPLLKRCYDVDDFSVRIRAISALTVLYVKDDQIPRIVHEMGNILDSSNTNGSELIVLFHAAVCLTRYGDKIKDAGAVQALLKRLNDRRSFELRRMCIRALQSCGYVTPRVPLPEGKHAPPDPNVTMALLNILNDKTSSQVRLEAVIALGSMGPPESPTLQKTVAERLHRQSGQFVESDKMVRIWSLVSWIAIDKPHEEGIAALKGYALKDPEQRIRLQAVQGLGLVASHAAKSVVPTLRTLMKDDDQLIAAAAIGVLGPLGTDAKDAIQDLTEMAHNDHEDFRGLRLQAIGALGLIATKVPAVGSILKKLLKEKDPLVVATAVGALARLGKSKEADEAIEVLKEMAQNKEVEKKVLRHQAIAALGVLATKFNELLPMLVNMLRDSDQDVVASAIAAIAGMGKKGEPAVPALRALTKDNTVNKGIKVLAEAAISAILEKSVDLKKN